MRAMEKGYKEKDDGNSLEIKESTGELDEREREREREGGERGRKMLDSCESVYCRQKPMGFCGRNTTKIVSAQRPETKERMKSGVLLPKERKREGERVVKRCGAFESVF